MMLVLFIVFAFKESPTFFQNEKREKTFDIKKGNPFQAMKLIFATSPYIALLGLIYALNFLSLSDISSSSYLYHLLFLFLLYFYFYSYFYFYFYFYFNFYFNFNFNFYYYY